jgi:hypothetical protein
MSPGLNGLFAFPANTRSESIVKSSLIGAVRMAAFRVVDVVTRIVMPPVVSITSIEGRDHVQV